jgi:hypothetical protein
MQCLSTSHLAISPSAAPASGHKNIMRRSYVIQPPARQPLHIIPRGLSHAEGHNCRGGGEEDRAAGMPSIPHSTPSAQVCPSAQPHSPPLPSGDDKPTGAIACDSAFSAPQFASQGRQRLQRRPGSSPAGVIARHGVAAVIGGQRGPGSKSMRLTSPAEFGTHTHSPPCPTTPKYPTASPIRLIVGIHRELPGWAALTPDSGQRGTARRSDSSWAGHVVAPSV